MRITNPRRFSLRFTAIGCTLLAMGHFGCNQGASTVATETVPEPTAKPSMSQPAPENAILVEERKLVGEELQTFLKEMQKDLKVEPVSAEPTEGLGKSAANPACLIDFFSNKGLWYMPDRAYRGIANAPYYYQPCFPQYVFVEPSIGTHYYLPTEATGTCAGAYGMIGTSSGGNCINQKDAALFPRYASNGTLANKAVGLNVQMLDVNRNPYLFRSNYFFARGGSIMVYGYKPITRTWSVWGPFNQTPGFVSLQNGTDLSILQFFSTNKAGVFQVDNISITGN